MNLTEAIKISAKATDALDAAIGSAMLLLAKKKQEREARLQRFDDIVTVMEAEKDAADHEIAALEVLIFGKKKTEKAPEMSAEDQAEELTQRAGEARLLPGRTQEAAE